MLDNAEPLPEWISPLAKVRATYDPARRGVTTGKTCRRGTSIYVEIRFDSGETDFEDSRHLEPVPEQETRRMAFERLRFSGSEALRDALLMEKVRGELTDVHYAMGSGNAEFHPHQFKPVMRFVRSALGRMLIADEVGLGKTIEAIYIWRELQARTDARRLLVICPAGLRRKWQGELAARFAIQADIVNAQGLLNLAERAVRDPSCSFAVVAGLEAIRAKLPEVVNSSADVREQLLEFLEQHKASAESAIFDLTIIDEAHHLRNSATASYQAGQLVIEASSHTVLLSATPLQTSSDNLYRLLHLLDPDRFSAPDAFAALQEANAPLTQALNALQAHPPRATAFHEAMTRLTRSPFFRDDPTITDIATRHDILAEPAARVDASRLLEARSLYGDVMTRTRKRDVTLNRVQRTSRVIRVRLSAEEHRLYQSLKERLRQAVAWGEIGSVFAVIARERQLSSSIPATLARWGDTETLDEVLEEAVLQTIDAKAEVANLNIGLDVRAKDFERIDSKFAEFLAFLREALVADPTEKFVVFTFFRGTIEYLGRRLVEAGIETASIWGGMGDAKFEEIAHFRQGGASVLLSTEVGSEGIDLQFARFVINYDLPWNPMKIEQRIGRIDRIGQRAERINVVSFVIQGTIDETIVDRLYERIGLFTQSIGDLEEILGDSVEKLTLEYFRNSLNDAELAVRLDANAMAAEQNRAQIKEIEEDIAELAGHSRFLHESITQDRDAGRWVRPEDLSDFLTSFLHRHYPGSSMRRDLDDHGRLLANLNAEARADLHRFIQDTRPARTTRLHIPGAAVPLVFDARHSRGGGARPELVDLTHPVIHWARTVTSNEVDQAECVVALALSSAVAGIEPGLFVFAVDFWRMEGVRKDVRLAAAVWNVAADSWLDREAADRLIDQAARDGLKHDLGDDEAIHAELLEVFVKCEDELHARYVGEKTRFREDNKQTSDRAKRLITERTDRRIRDLRIRLDAQRRSQDIRRQRAAAMTEGLIRREEEARDQRIHTVSQQSTPRAAMRPVAGGVIIVR